MCVRAVISWKTTTTCPSECALCKRKIKKRRENSKNKNTSIHLQAKDKESVSWCECRAQRRKQVREKKKLNALYRRWQATQFKVHVKELACYTSSTSGSAIRKPFLYSPPQVYPENGSFALKQQTTRIRKTPQRKNIVKGKTASRTLKSNCAQRNCETMHSWRDRRKKKYNRNGRTRRETKNWSTIWYGTVSVCVYTIVEHTANERTQ